MIPLVIPLAGEPPATSVTAPSSPGLITRVGRCFKEAPRAVSGLPGTARRMSIKLQTGVAEFLLVTRLRARSPSAHAARQSEDVIQHGAHIVDVTCKSWFVKADPKRAPQAYRTQL